MDTAMLKDIAGSYGIFCALFIMMLVYQLKQNIETVKKFESREREMLSKYEEQARKYDDREKTLLNIIDGYKAELARLTEAVNRLYDRLDK